MTGGSAGIGFGIVANLLHHNAAKIIILSSNAENYSRARKDLEEWGDVSRLDWIQCDLTDLAQVDDVAKKLRSTEKRIDGVGSSTVLSPERVTSF